MAFMSGSRHSFKSLLARCGCCVDGEGQAVEAVGTAIDQLSDKPKTSVPEEVRASPHKFKALTETN